jgi:ribosomal protein L40E
MPGKNKTVFNKGICDKCGAPLPAHKLNCEYLQSPETRKELVRRRTWRRRNAQRKQQEKDSGKK